MEMKNNNNNNNNDNDDNNNDSNDSNDNSNNDNDNNDTSWGEQKPAQKGNQIQVTNAKSLNLRKKNEGKAAVVVVVDVVVVAWKQRGFWALGCEVQFIKPLVRLLNLHYVQIPRLKTFLQSDFLFYNKMYFGGVKGVT